MHVARTGVTVCLLVVATATGVSAQTPRPASAPVNVVVVFDDSGSMGQRMRTSAGRKIDAAQRALTDVLADLPANTNVGVLALNSQVAGSNWIVPLGPLAENDWQGRIASIKANGGTPLGEFLKLGADALLAERATNTFGYFRLLVVTDGEANDEALVDAYLPDILSRGIVLDAIGVDMQTEHSLARRAHSYRSAADDRSLQRAIQEVFAETSPDDQAAAEDFELLAALPDEFASQAIRALTQQNNEPIQAQQNRVWPFDDAASTVPGTNNTPHTTNDPNATNDPNTTNAPNTTNTVELVATLFTGLLCCACPLVLLLCLALVIFVIRRRCF